MSHPDVMMGGSTTVHFSKCTKKLLLCKDMGGQSSKESRRAVCKQEIHASTLSGTIFTNARITKQIDDMREALRQTPRRRYAA